MTAYSLTPVGAEGVEQERTEVIDIPSRAELLVENGRLAGYLEAARADNARWRQAWCGAVDERIAVQVRLSRASRVLASLERLSPRMAGLVSAARREIWRLDE